MTATAEITALTIPDDLAAALAKAKGPVTFKTQAGRAIGQLTPVPPEPLVPWDPTLTEDMLDQMEKEGGECTLAEIWQRLGVR